MVTAVVSNSPLQQINLSIKELRMLGGTTQETTNEKEICDTHSRKYTMPPHEELKSEAKHPTASPNRKTPEKARKYEETQTDNPKQETMDKETNEHREKERENVSQEKVTGWELLNMNPNRIRRTCHHGWAPNKQMELKLNDNNMHPGPEKRVLSPDKGQAGIRSHQRGRSDTQTKSRKPDKGSTAQARTRAHPKNREWGPPVNKGLDRLEALLIPIQPQMKQVSAQNTR